MINRELAERTAQLAAQRAPCVVATVVRARRPTSVRPGDAAVVLADGTIEGFIGGVCAASSVRLHSLKVLETGEPLLLRLEPGDGTGSSNSEEGAIVERNPCLSGGSMEIFLDPQLPAPAVAVTGTSPIAQAVRQIGQAMGYELVSADGGLPEGAAALIVASHGAGEEQLLAQALTAGVPYVALVASTIRGAAVRDALAVPVQLRAQLHTPAGLDIGARTPAEIAISILAELVAERHAVPGAGVRAGEAAADPATAIDPICGMTVAAVSSSPHLDTAAGRVFFCCTGCRDKYAEQHAADVAAH
jgi:xanthine dehydrogenase accessory factor